MAAGTMRLTRAGTGYRGDRADGPAYRREPGPRDGGEGRAARRALPPLGRPLRRFGLDPARRVASLGQIGHRQCSEPVQAAGPPRTARSRAASTSMYTLEASTSAVSSSRPARHASSRRASTRCPSPPGPLPAGLDRLGIELLLQRGGLAAQLLGPQAGCRLRRGPHRPWRCRRSPSCGCRRRSTRPGRRR